MSLCFQKIGWKSMEMLLFKISGLLQNWLVLCPPEKKGMNDPKKKERKSCWRRVWERSHSGYLFQPSETLEISLFRNCRRSGMGRDQCRSIQGWGDDFLRAMVAVDECFFGIGVMADAAGSCFFCFYL